jgi:hypothetical protein
MTPSPGTIGRKAAAILRALRGRIRQRAMLAFSNPENAPSGYAKYSSLTTRIYIHILLVRSKFEAVS